MNTARAILLIAAILVTAILVLGTGWRTEQQLIVAHVLTMDPSLPVAEAVLVEGERILAVGSQSELMALASKHVMVSELPGQTLIPGFIDAHSHFPSNGIAVAGVDLSPTPAGSVDSLDLLLQALRREALTRSDGAWIIGFNYDDSALDIKRHPTRDELDAILPHQPVYIRHRSGHMGVANSRALQELGKDQEQENGLINNFIGRDANGRLNGLLQESASPSLWFLLKKLPPRRLVNAFFAARDEYLEAGITTLQNGYADKMTTRLLFWAGTPVKGLLDPGKNAQQLTAAKRSDRVAAILDWPDSDVSSLKLGAIKLIADGSPQGRTAWLTKPYLKPPPSSAYHDTGFHGHPAMPPAHFKQWVKRYHAAGLQLAMHGNGDAAIDLIIESLTEAYESAGTDGDYRHIVVHGQTMREDQLAKLATLKATVSFFPAHTWYWGDWYRFDVLGEQRAASISPLAAAEALGVRYTVHSDAPVTSIDPFQIIWSSTERKTRSGFVLGAKLAVGRQRVLEAMTIDAAWQNHIENDRGSLTVGKLADMVVLSDDPLTIDDVRNLRVNRVWIGGKLMFSAR